MGRDLRAAPGGAGGQRRRGRGCRGLPRRGAATGTRQSTARYTLHFRHPTPLPALLPVLSLARAAPPAGSWSPRRGRAARAAGSWSPRGRGLGFPACPARSPRSCSARALSLALPGFSARRRRRGGGSGGGGGGRGAPTMSGEEEAAELTIAEDLVVTKYKMGGDIANRVLRAVVEEANSGASVLCLCEKGDAMIMEETGKIFKKEKEMKKGIAFPTSISVNNCVCHFSPLKSDQDYILKDGDLVKIDLGVHVDGFIANVAHSFVINASKENPVSGRKADVIKAAHLCAEAALRLVKPGNQNTQVTDAWNKIAHSFHCTPIEGMLSHQLKQHVIDGEKTIIQNPTDQQKKDHEKAEFEVHEVYAVDVLVSSGEGKAKDAGQRTTIYKRDPSKQYGLKMKTSRAFFSEVERRFDTMPFTLRAFEDEKKARMGVVECAKHELLQPFNVLYEKEGEFVAQFKFTVLLMPNGPMRITSGPFEPELYKSEFEVQDGELKALLQSSASRKTQKKKKKKASKNAENATTGETAEENEAGD
ncbi:proliferation-associated protein 2G4 [Phasianus colchicus]|uniref:Proliferation-associated protein 2G4 n=1 Tax=Phasianus colchicus TaxID=9054 RepID=A0A669QLJ3_PHACC|nr:proliferation-associated protein 2G4 [Phasianus colchicus]